MECYEKNMVLLYIIVAWLSFSLGMFFSQTNKGKEIIYMILGMLDNAGIKNKKDKIVVEVIDVVPEKI